MWARHCVEVDWDSICGSPRSSVALVVSEAVLDTDDDPLKQLATEQRLAEQFTNQRLVKTTPKPRATKNSKGELVGPLLLLLLLEDGALVAGATEEIVEDILGGARWFHMSG